jgi:hypothetical protein
MGQLPGAPAQLRDTVPRGRPGRQDARRSDGASRGCERERVHDDDLAARLEASRKLETVVTPENVVTG